MEKATKTVAWICILSTLLMGCYTSTLVDPTGGGKEEVYTGKIEYVVMKDSTRFVFDEPPTVVNDTIFGQVTIEKMAKSSRWRHVSLLLSDVAEVFVTDLNVGLTVMGLVLGVGLLVGILWILEQPKFTPSPVF